MAEAVATAAAEALALERGNRRPVINGDHYLFIYLLLARLHIL